MGHKNIVEGQLFTYEILKRLGQGAFGEVSSARVLENGRIVAVKRIPIRASDGLPNNVVREFKALQLIEHKNVVTIEDAFPKGQAVYLVQEYCITDLSNVIKRQMKPIPEAIVKGLLQQILLGLHALHSSGIVHRDMKPSNILLTHHGVAKIGDFGLSRPLNGGDDPNYTHTVATRWYRPPEILYGSRSYGSSVDIWSVGLIFAEMLALSPLVAGDSDINQLSVTIQIFGDIEPRWPAVDTLPDFGKVCFPHFPGIPLRDLLPAASPPSLTLLEKLLIYDPDQRLTAEEALWSPYFVTEPLPAGEGTISRWLGQTLVAGDVAAATMAAIAGHK